MTLVGLLNYKFIIIKKLMCMINEINIKIFNYQIIKI